MKKKKKRSMFFVSLGSCFVSKICKKKPLSKAKEAEKLWKEEAERQSLGEGGKEASALADARIANERAELQQVITEGKKDVMANWADLEKATNKSI